MKKIADIIHFFELPLNELLFKAQEIHRKNFANNEIQISTLLSIKTGGCAEDCSYCPQSAKYDTGTKAEKLISIDEVKKQAETAKESGATRFCMGAAWREVKDRDIPKLVAMVDAVKSLGLETCMTLGMINPLQAKELKDAGLDYYNHNLDTSENFYKEIISTRTYQDRLDSLDNIANAGLKTCSGGIIGMGETREDIAEMLLTLANLPSPPESVPINMLIPINGTPMENIQNIDIFEFIRTIAIARLIMPTSYIRLSAGRENMSDTAQAMCFMAGANSIFYGEKLLTANNPSENKDKILLKRLSMNFATK